MRVLFDCPVPFSFAHGGQQIQIEQTKLALERLGVEVDYLRWWDSRQAGDLLHYFGRPPVYLTRAAQQKGLKVLAADLLTAPGSRSNLRRGVQKLGTQILTKTLPNSALSWTGWACLRLADACVALTTWEAHLLNDTYGVPRSKIHVVPNGVEPEFLDSKPGQRGRWLVCTATITQRKGVVKLAKAAVQAKVPVWIIGKPYRDDDPYFREFLSITTRFPDIIRFEGPISDRSRMAKTYKEARGFVLLSTMESLSLSALEAAGCGCPLLLSDIPWARSVFGNRASYCTPGVSTKSVANLLRRFYESAPSLPLVPKPLGWGEVAMELRSVYRKILE